MLFINWGPFMLNIDWQRLESLVRPAQDSLWGIGSEEKALGYGYSEDAMRRLNETQQNACDSICMKYPYDDEGLENTLEDLNTYLLHLTTLPKDDEGDLYQAEYYHDVFHTAYRCLIRPPSSNPWISSHAYHARKDHLNRPQTTAFSQAHLKTIAAIWGGLTDENFFLEEGYTRACAKELFAETLSDIGRAHNRDNNLKQDDGQADKPSCEKGINQRLVQFIMIVLQEKTLDVDLMKQKFQECFINANQNGQMTVFDKIEKLDLEILIRMRKAFEDLIMLQNTQEEKALLGQLFSWKTEDIACFIKECKASYGDDLFTKKLAKTVYFQEKRFNNFGELILCLARDPLSAYFQAIKDKIENKINQLLQRKILKPARRLEERSLGSSVAISALGGATMGALLLSGGVASIATAAVAGGIVSVVGRVVENAARLGFQGAQSAWGIIRREALDNRQEGSASFTKAKKARLM